MEGTATLLGELKLLARSLMRWLYAFIGFSTFYFLVGPVTVSILGRSVTLPFFTAGDSYAVLFFKLMQRDFVPAGVTLIVTNPLSGFITQLEIALTLAFITASPYFLYRFMHYLSPALFSHERKAVFQALTFSSILFLLGCLFAYFFMIPLTFKFMYPFTTALEVTPLFSLDAFMAWVIGILLATGITFLLPLFMVLLSYLGIVTPHFWRSKWRHAFLSLLIFSAVITPDQTGITMALLLIPLLILYAGGAWWAGKVARG